MNVSDEHDDQSLMFRPTITDMQDKYCGNCYDIYPIQSQYKGGGHHNRSVVSFVLALNEVNIVAVTAILVLHVGNGWCTRV